MKIPIRWVTPLLLVSAIGSATASITWPGNVNFRLGGNLPSIVGPGSSSLNLNCVYTPYRPEFRGQVPVPRVSWVYGSPGASGGFGWPTDVGVIFDCGLDSTTGLRVPAMDVLLASTFLATFTDGTGQYASPLTGPLPAPYTDIGLVAESLYGHTCHASDLVADLGADTSAGPATANLADGSYNYCIFFDVSTVGGSTGLANAFQQFGIQWTQ